mmetsp:Transcript_4310/g.6392  ORF Transcript_4310/g.6392 Transcript_4310/m.6392 type:complete len:226 (-) Transcript_4310:1804-2481(-)|eukprot:CAMPEP_0203747010 /NCGR_PEP_ID=MMETSP0098-20131031/2276_1 /ASSEMBLY_ACC=CAM_ASM_000208 /TAXON_ID=96639 /ORGANISM=" , Strain NY0313808BC1" /LENGTH=225 /DNA_ID=CAMNT_0050635291 /DNA_START=112 /DNA_END=789 /DNA_ORIENTATION=-
MCSFLPYGETPLTADVESRVESLIRRECKLKLNAQYAGVLDVDRFLEQQGHTSKFFNSDEAVQGKLDKRIGAFLGNEIKRVSDNRMPVDYAKEERYQICPKPDQADSVEAWKKANERNSLVLERLENDLVNAELQVKFGQSSWKVYAQAVEGMATRAKSLLKNEIEIGTEINQERKGTHVKTMEDLNSLQTKWKEHINQIHLIQMELGSTQENGDPRATKRQKLS